MRRSDYLSFRRKFEPASVKLVIVAESPPASGKYFYNPAGVVTEHLFTALMKQRWASGIPIRWPRLRQLKQQGTA